MFSFSAAASHASSPYLEVILILEASCGLETVSVLLQGPLIAWTYEFVPCFSHVLWNAALDRLDVSCTEAGSYGRLSQFLLDLQSDLGVMGLPVLLCFGRVKPGPTGP